MSFTYLTARMCMVGMIKNILRGHSSSTCVHIINLEKIIEDTSGDGMLPQQLRPFADSHIAKETGKKQNLIGTVSYQNIPFDLPPQLKSVLVMDNSQRFNIIDGVAHLVPMFSLALPYVHSVVPE